MRAHPCFSPLVALAAIALALPLRADPPEPSKPSFAAPAPPVAAGLQESVQSPNPPVDDSERKRLLSVRASVDLAIAEIENKRYDRALDALADAQRLAPQDPFVINLAGAALTKKGQFAEARKQFDKALDLTPGYFPAKFNLGELLFLEKKYPEALAYFRAMLQADPTNELLQFKVFLCYLEMGSKDEAQNVLKSMRYPADSPAWHYAQAAWEIEAGNPGKAGDYIEGATFIYGKKTLMFQETFDDLGLTKKLR